MNIVGQRIKLLRNSLGISQSKIGELAGTSLDCINRYERGASSPPLNILLWYADHFDVSLDYIFGRTDKPQGKLYEYKPKIETDSEEMRQFIEMCFDPESPMNERLKETLVGMLGEAKKK